jgi:hypothetical protein
MAFFSPPPLSTRVDTLERCYSSVTVVSQWCYLSGFAGEVSTGVEMRGSEMVVCHRRAAEVLGQWSSRRVRRPLSRLRVIVMVMVMVMVMMMMVLAVVIVMVIVLYRSDSLWPRRVCMRSCTSRSKSSFSL